MTIKSFTDIQQSRKLAEILPLESADMFYCNGHVSVLQSSDFITVNSRMREIYPEAENYIPAWSLSALLSVLPRIGGIKPVLDLETNCIQYPSDIDLSVTADNSVDACYEMILKLHELKML